MFGLLGVNDEWRDSCCHEAYVFLLLKVEKRGRIRAPGWFESMLRGFEIREVVYCIV